MLLQVEVLMRSRGTSCVHGRLNRPECRVMRIIALRGRCLCACWFEEQERKEEDNRKRDFRQLLILR